MNSSIAIANIVFDQVYKSALARHGRPGSVYIMTSTSGLISVVWSGDSMPQHMYCLHLSCIGHYS